MKKHIPNILTTYRIVVALIIPILFYNGLYNLLLSSLIVAIISDSLDGYLARKWNVTSMYGKFADMIGDKLLVISAISTLIGILNKFFIVLLILEFIIAIINMIPFFKCDNLKNIDISKINSSKFGKFKTVFLFITLLIGYLSYKMNILNELVIPLLITTSILQVITAIDYLLRNKEN